MTKNKLLILITILNTSLLHSQDANTSQSDTFSSNPTHLTVINQQDYELSSLFRLIALKELNSLSKNRRQPLDIALNLLPSARYSSKDLLKFPTDKGSLEIDFGFHTISQALIESAEFDEQTQKAYEKILDNQIKLIKTLCKIIYYEQQHSCLEQTINIINKARNSANNKNHDILTLDILQLENQLLELDFEYNNAIADFYSLTGREYSSINTKSIIEKLESQILIFNTAFDLKNTLKTQSLKQTSKVKEQKALHQSLSLLPKLKVSYEIQKNTKTLTIPFEISSKSILEIRKAKSEASKAKSEYEKSFKQAQTDYDKASHEYSLSRKSFEISTKAFEIANAIHHKLKNNQTREYIESCKVLSQKRYEALKAKSKCIENSLILQLQFSNNKYQHQMQPVIIK